MCVLLRLPCKNEEKKDEPWSEDRNQAVVPQVQAGVTVIKLKGGGRQVLDLVWRKHQ